MIKKERKEQLFELYKMTLRKGVTVGEFQQKFAAYIGRDVGLFVSFRAAPKLSDRLMVEDD